MLETSRQEKVHKISRNIIKKDKKSILILSQLIDKDLHMNGTQISQTSCVCKVTSLNFPLHLSRLDGGTTPSLLQGTWATFDISLSPCLHRANQPPSPIHLTS